MLTFVVSFTVLNIYSRIIGLNHTFIIYTADLEIRTPFFYLETGDKMQVICISVDHESVKSI